MLWNQTKPNHTHTNKSISLHLFISDASYLSIHVFTYFSLRHQFFSLSLPSSFFFISAYNNININFHFLLTSLIYHMPSRFTLHNQATILFLFSDINFCIICFALLFFLSFFLSFFFIFLCFIFWLFIISYFTSKISSPSPTKINTLPTTVIFVSIFLAHWSQLVPGAVLSC